MLTGTIKVKPSAYSLVDSEGSVVAKSTNTGFTYRFEGVDNSSMLYGKLTSSVYDAIQYMSGTTDESSYNELWERRFNVNLGSVKVQVGYCRDENDKLKKYSANYDFFCRLGATIRYAKRLCKDENAEGYTGLMSASGEFTPNTQVVYHIKVDTVDGIQDWGTVTLNLGEISAMHIDTPLFKIDIDDDAGLEMEVFQEIKNSAPKGFAFNSEYLGVSLKPQVVETVSNASGMYGSLEEIIKANPDREFEWLLGKNYQIVTEEMLPSLVEEFENLPDDTLIYYDTETTGLNINFKSRIGQADQCVGIILSYEDGVSYFFPMQMKSIPNLCNGDHFYFMQKYMKHILESKQIVAHNMSFDWKVAYIYDINANIVHDTITIYSLTLGQERQNFSVGLKSLAKLLLHRDSLELSDLVLSDKWGENDVRFWDLPPELVRLYACTDTDNTRGIMQYAIQNDLLHKYNATRVYEIEIAFSKAVAYQEFYGHKIDTDNLNILHKEIDKELKENYDKMVEIVGYEFNPNSSKQLVQIMYEELGIPAQISRKTGRPTTDKETLKNLAETTDLDGNPKYPFASYLQKYRVAEGVRKIVDKFPELATEDGYLFSEVQQYGTTTGRVSIKKPNYQSYNDAVKKNIVPRPGFYMTDTDYSSVEYRVLGNMANNKMIKEGFVDPDFDYHQYQAARMYGVPYSAVTSKLRKAAKGINFGLPYGMGDESLGIRVFGEKSEENTRKAAALRAKYFEGQEDIKEFFDKARAGGVSNGYTETYFGRRRYYHRNTFSVAAIRRQAGNAVIQGTAADIYKLAVGRLFLRICREGWLGKVLLTGFIHDEVLCEVHNSIDPMKWLKVLREEFEVKIEGWCPLYMGFGFGMSWYEAKKTELPIQLQWELVNKYGETGYPKWHGDGKELCAEVPHILRDFSIRHVINCITGEEFQGKEIKAATNKALMDVLSDDVDVYNSFCAKQENGVSLAEIDKYNEELKGYSEGHLDHLLVKDNEVLLKISKPKLTQVALDLFCDLHNVDRAKVDLKDIEENTVADNQAIDTSSIVLDTDDEAEEDRVRARMDSRVEAFGLYLDTDNSIIILKMLPPNLMAFIKQHSNMEGKGYRIRFKDTEHKMMYDTQAYIASEEVPTIQDLYIKYLSANR